MDEGWEGLLEARYFPLSPLHAVHCKLFIATLRGLPVASASAGIYLLNGHSISRVEVLGLVVRRDVKDGRMLFVVDDSTGLLEVLVWEKRFEREQQIEWEVVQLGTLVRVRGRLSCYLGAPQLTLSSLDVLPEGSDGVLEEVEQWKQIAELSEAYKASDAHLDGMDALLQEQAMLRRVLKRHAVPQTESECLVAVFVCLSEAESGTVAEASLLELVCDDAPLIRAALCLLCDNGSAYWEQQEEVLVTQIRPEGNLGAAIVEIVKESAEEGIRVPQLMQQLQSDYRWRCVRSDLVDAALEHLTTESLVFNDGEALYKLVV
jgi:RPA family protein